MVRGISPVRAPTVLPGQLRFSLAADLFLLSSRDRKQAELDLQNARRKETREMARDLESQLAAVERIAQVCRHCSSLYVAGRIEPPCMAQRCFACPSRALSINAVVALSNCQTRLRLCFDCQARQLSWSREYYCQQPLPLRIPVPL